MKFIFLSGPSLLILLLILHAATIRAQQDGKNFLCNQKTNHEQKLSSWNNENVCTETEYDYDPKSKKGPSKWGYLNPEWAACKDGKMQSPINFSWKLRPECVPSSEAFITQYKPSTTTLKKTSHMLKIRMFGVQMEWTGDAGSIQINGTNYNLLEAHWHILAEHTFDGYLHLLERHMVHINQDTNQIAVIAVLYQINNRKSDPLISMLMRNLTSIAEINVKETYPGMIDPNEISYAAGNEQFYRYMGSLTTPPCTEAVIWIVMSKIRAISKEQFKLLLHANDGKQNARPLQPINGREVHLYDPREKIDWSIFPLTQII